MCACFVFLYQPYYSYVNLNRLFYFYLYVGYKNGTILVLQDEVSGIVVLHKLRGHTQEIQVPKGIFQFVDTNVKLKVYTLDIFNFPTSLLCSIS